MLPLTDVIDNECCHFRPTCCCHCVVFCVVSDSVVTSLTCQVVSRMSVQLSVSCTVSVSLSDFHKNDNLVINRTECKMCVQLSLILMRISKTITLTKKT